jgi:hypothetical protein
MEPTATPKKTRRPGAGRKPGTGQYPHAHRLLFGAEDLRRLEALEARLGVSRNEVFRRGLAALADQVAETGEGRDPE